MPQFFKIILDETLKTNKLLLPEKFVTLYGQSLSDSVTLKLPFDCEWRIGLEKVNGDIRLHNGWPEFSDHYSIVRGYMLVFAYEGNSEFRVTIFDQSTYEIDHYPCSSPPLLEGLTSNTYCERSSDSEEKKCHAKKHRKADILRCMRPFGHREKPKYLKMAKRFASDKPHFEVIMQPSYVIGSRLSIPAKFAKAHLQHRQCNVTLYGSGGRSWPVKYHSGFYAPAQRYATARFYEGWKAFVRDNGLDVSNVCVFVLINGRARVSFDVIIFRDSDDKDLKPYDEYSFCST